MRNRAGIAGLRGRGVSVSRGMSDGPRQQWEMDKAAAAALLADRGRRRRALGGFAAAMLAMLALGLWGIDGWLEKSLLRFTLYWCGCGVLSLFVMLFALFDALAVIREERGRGA